MTNDKILAVEGDLYIILFYYTNS